MNYAKNGLSLNVDTDFSVPISCWYLYVQSQLPACVLKFSWCYAISATRAGLCHVPGTLNVDWTLWSLFC